MDVTYDHIDLSLGDGGTANVELARPDAMNSINEGMIDDLHDALERLRERETLRVLVVRGQGGNFSAGADLDVDLTALEPHEHVRNVRSIRELFDRLDDFPRPTVAAIEGHCLGGGCELACCFDTRVASTDATIGLPEVRLGLIPGSGGTQRLSRLIGVSRARDMVLRGTLHDAETMQEYGFVHELVEPESFDERLDAVVQDYLDRAPIAVELAKQVVTGGFEAPLATGLDMESLATGLLVGTDDASEGISAFQADRDPEFEGK